MRTITLWVLCFASPLAAAPLAPDVPAGADAARDAELAKLARPLLEAHGDGSARFLDGGGLVFASNRDGLSQLYVADSKPDAPARRLVTTRERIIDPVPLAGGKSVLFRSDRGADENWSIFRVDLDGKNLVELTPGEKLVRDNLKVVDGAAGTVFYTGRPMSTQESALWALDVAGKAKPRKIYSDAKTTFISDVSRDGKRALLTRLVSRSENVLLLVDLTTGAARPIYPTTGSAGINDASFSADGTRAIVATDGGGEQALLLSLDLATGKELARYLETHPATAAISGVEVSPKNDFVALTVTAGEHAEVRIVDAKTLAPGPKVALPLGWGGVSDISSDGTRFTLDWSTPTQPPDVFVVEARTGAVHKARNEPRPSLGKLPEVDVAVISIKAHDGGSIPTNVYRPRGTERRPVVVSYHGGPAGVSVIRWNPLATFFLSQGYAYVEPNVRGSTGFGRSYEMADNGKKRVEALKDVDTTAEWVAAQPWADKQRLVVMGGSYGGYTTLMALSRKPELWRAGVEFFGVVDWKTFMRSTSGVIRDIFRLEVGEPGRDDAFLEEISPIKYVARINRPLFVYAGANDPRVPRSESDMIVDALRKRSVSVEYSVKDDEGHSLARRPNQVEIYSRAARFLEKALRKQ